MCEELKGKKNGNCNRTDCQKPGATWYNHSTRMWYCGDCALWLNSDGYNRNEAMNLWGHHLCTHIDDPITIKAIADTELGEEYLNGVKVAIIGDAGEGRTTLTVSILNDAGHDVVVVDNPQEKLMDMDHRTMAQYLIEPMERFDEPMFYDEPNFLLSNTVQKGKRTKKKKRK